MELDYAILAERADGLTDGRYCIFGGDADCVEASKLPAPLQFALVARFLLGADEPLDGHTVALAITRPDGKRGDISTAVPLETKRNELDHEAPSGARVIINMVILVQDPGGYTLHIIGDGTERKAIRIYVKLIEPQESHKERLNGTDEVQNSE